MDPGHAGERQYKPSKQFVLTSGLVREAKCPRCQGFYDIHKDKPFFGELVEFMTSYKSHIMKLEKENAVVDFRTLIGATNPADAAEGTIRALYATSVGENAVHGSDSDENAAIEGAFHFSGREMF